ncbi:MAG: hypothetical protein WCH39_00660, partial [Schlesneria sp.]
FILSCFRDPLGDFSVWEMKMKTDHENRKHDRTASNSNKLEHPKKWGNNRHKRYKIREMVEVDRT